MPLTRLAYNVHTYIHMYMHTRITENRKFGVALQYASALSYKSKNNNNKAGVALGTTTQKAMTHTHTHKN